MHSPSGLVLTGIGSWPDVYINDVAHLVRDLYPGLPHLVELPQRGPGSDMVGRAMGLLSGVSDDFSVETTPTGWRLSQGRGRAMRRADAFLAQDLDVMEETFDGYEGLFKVQIAGPWTLAACIERTSGERALSDLGLCRELNSAFAQTAEQFVRQIQRRVPGATVLLQIDEPALSAVLSGTIPTQSGWAHYGPIDSQLVLELLRPVVNAVSAMANSVDVIVHSCASEVPFALLRSVGVKHVSIDATQFQAASKRIELHDTIGHAWEQGGFVVLGISPRDVKAGVQELLQLSDEIGLSPEDFRQSVVISAPCGFGGGTMSQARASVTLLQQVAREFSEVSS